MEQEATTTMAKTMSSTGTHSSFLPPMSLDGLVMDWESEFVWECPKCPGTGRIPYSQLEGHRNWHERINFLIGLKTGIQQQWSMPYFGPSTVGVLVDVNYAPSKGKHRKETLAHILTKKTPFTTVKYVAGLKYTFGNKSIGRQSNGEFVFLSLSNQEGRSGAWTRNQKEGKDKPKEENYFVLECKDGGTLVTSIADEGGGLGPVATIFINGLALQPSIPKKLDFGDVLTVSAVGMGGEEGRFRDFIFKEVPKDPRPAKRDAEVNTARVLQNPLVLQNVLRFHPTPNLQTLRVLSQLWNTEALKSLRSRVWVTVLDVNNRDRVIEQGLDFTSSELHHLHFPHWKIRFSRSDTGRNSGTPDEARRPAVFGCKLEEDLKCLLNKTHGVRSLVLSGQPKDNQSEWWAFQALLSSLRHSLTKLVLDIALNVHIHLLFEGDFPCLRYLSIEANICTAPSLSVFLRELLPKVGSIETLKLGKDLSHEAIQRIGRLQGEEGTHKFGNLRSITILEARFRDRQALALLRRNSLKELHLGGLNPIGGRMMHLQLGLEQQAESLQELTLNFNLEVGDANFRIDFPQSMPNLETLCLLVKSAQARNVGRIVRCSFGQNVDATFVDYRASFPSLKTLRVWPANNAPFHGSDTPRTAQGARWNEFIRIQMAFLVPGMDAEGIPIPMPRLQTVDTPFLIQGVYNPGLDHLETTFPNANFPPELASARGQPDWLQEEEEDEVVIEGAFFGRRPR